jgi:hypothetical protein
LAVGKRNSVRQSSTAGNAASSILIILSSSRACAGEYFTSGGVSFQCISRVANIGACVVIVGNMSAMNTVKVAVDIVINAVLAVCILG